MEEPKNDDLSEEDSKAGILSANMGPDGTNEDNNSVPHQLSTTAGNSEKGHSVFAKKSKFWFTASASLLASASSNLEKNNDGSSSSCSRAANASSPGPTTKNLSQNYNGTVVFTSNPTNEAELQLFRVMQRASLLAYYDTLLEMGGDDVQQLCDAGEEEFLEIMALVGMASKPLHVRRFQKALQEWLTNPLIFQTPLVKTSNNSGGSNGNSGAVNFIPRPLSVHNVTSSPMSITSVFANSQAINTPASSPSSTATQQLGEISSCTPGTSASPIPGPSCSLSPSLSMESIIPANHNIMNPVLDESQIFRLEEAAQNLVANLPELEPKYHTSKKKVGKDLEAVLNMSEDDPQRMQQIRKYSAIYGRFDCKRKPEKPLTLHEVSVNEAAAQICRYIPALLTRRDELFPLARQVVRDSGYHYSKGHSKSSAANNLTRLNFGDGYNPDQTSSRKRWSSSEIFAEGVDQLPPYRQDRLEQISIEIQHVSRKMDQLTSQLAHSKKDTSEYISIKYQRDILQSKQNQLFQEHSSLQNSNEPSSSRRSKFRKYTGVGATSYGADCDRTHDTDETDSQLSYSNASSPYQEYGESGDSMRYEQAMSDAGRSYQDNGFMGDETLPCSVEIGDNNEIPDCDSGYGTLRQELEDVQVIAAKGDNIIAVTNPALLLSSTKIKVKEEQLSPVAENSIEDDND